MNRMIYKNINRIFKGSAIILMAAMIIISVMSPAFCLNVSAEPSDEPQTGTVVTTDSPDFEADVENPKQSSAENFNPITSNSGYSAIMYNNTNGLPTSEANAILQASDGFIWIGSYGGLVRYDGSNFVRMDDDADILGVRTLFEDSKNRLWIGSNGQGVVMMERGRFTHWSNDERFSTAVVMTIIEDDSGLIYVGTQDGIAMIGDDMELVPLSDKRLLGNNIKEFKKGEDGLIYGLTHTGDIFTLKNGNVNSFLGKDECTVKNATSILSDPDDPGSIYVGTSDCVVYHGRLDNNFKDCEEMYILPLPYTTSLEYVNGDIWICSVNGAAMLYGEAANDSENVPVLKGVPMNNSIGHVICDYLGNYWFTSTRQGVMKIVPNQFENLSYRYGINEGVVNSTCMYDGKLFVATDSGLYIIDGNGLTSSYMAGNATYPELEDDLIELYRGERIRALSVDSCNRLWISDWGEFGLICLDNGIYKQIQDMTSYFIRNICELNDGSIAVALNGGMDIVKDGEVIRHYTQEDGITNTDSLTVAKGENGDILLGSDGGGLYIINGDTVRNIGKKDGLTSDVIMRIRHDRTRDLYWLVTGNSIAVMTPDYKVSTVTSFPYMNNFDMYQNSNDMMWVLGGEGIYIIPTEDMVNDNINNYSHYGLSDGLPYIATANSYSYLSEKDTLIIAGNNGIARVNIEDFISDTGNLKASIPFIDADGVKIYPDENGIFKLSQYVRKIKIYSYVFNYSLVKPQVSYALEGFDTEYMTVSRDQLVPVDYTNLFGGEYRFVLRIPGDNDNEDIVVSADITKEKAITEQLWFYALIIVTGILMICGIVQLILHFRLKRIKAKHAEEVERERIVTELETASNIQTGMLPSIFPPFPERKEFDLFASMDPAKEVGGDFYDFFMIDDDHLCLVIADVSGKGVPAALVMMASKIVIADFAKMNNSPEDILFAANDSICENNSEEMFVSAWLGILEISTGKLTAANAGHEYPAMMKPDGKFELIKDRRSMVLGGIPGTKYHNYELVLEPGSKLFVYTDGVPEATNSAEDLFDLERMVDALNKDTKAGPEQILKNVRAAVDEFVMDAEQFDDLTMLCIEYKGVTGEKTETKYL